jgi:hypothetical protein
MMKSLKKTEENTQSRLKSEVGQEVGESEESPNADIISHMLSIGSAHEKTLSHDPNYKLTMEVKNEN